MPLARSGLRLRQPPQRAGVESDLDPGRQSSPMRDAPWAGLSGPFLACLLLAVALSGCTGDNKSTDDGSPGHPYDTTRPGEHAAIAGLTHLFAEGPAPPLEATTLDGDTFRLSDHVGKVVFVEFMGAGCGSCVRNLPDHQRIYGEFGADPAFTFIGIDVWDRETEDDLRDYRDRHEIAWPLAMAPPGAEEDYEVRGTPTQYLIDHEGRWHSRGAVLSYASMRAEISYLLDQLPAP